MGSSIIGLQLMAFRILNLKFIFYILYGSTLREVEILCIGNELLSGITLNTNAHWIGKKITKVGAKVRRVIVVADDLEEINIALMESLARKPDWIVTCGGLGPTYDDMTIQAVARSLKRKLILNPIALQMVKDTYKRLGQNVRLNSARLKMAMIPQDSKPIHNPIGNAPAVYIFTKKTQIVCLPGVPSEMKAIYAQHFRQYQTRNRTIRS